MREREKERERYKNTSSLVNHIYFHIGSPTIFIGIFSITLSSLTVSLYFVPGGVSQVLRKESESV